jgi:GrpB-like predicted nucleotidyltransferase (UPF0157 family)
VVGECVIVPYDAEWPRLFDAERRLLESVLAPWLSAGIHHVGSTAVPGMPAKPTIDMIGGVRSLREAEAARSALSGLGYAYGDHRPEALWFRKPGACAWWEASHGLHLTEPGSDLWRERLAFRDALRADAALAGEYRLWKLEHAARQGDPAPYRASKTPFVASVLARAGIELKPDAERLAPAGQRRGHPGGHRIAPCRSRS